MKKMSMMKRLLCMMLTLTMIVGGMHYEVFAESLLQDNEADTGYELLVQESTGADAADTLTEDKSEADAADTPSADAASEKVEVVEINQGLSLHTKREGGRETLIRDFAACKTTAIMMKIPGSESYTREKAEETVLDYTLEAKAVSGGRESDDCELCDTLDNLEVTVTRLYDSDCNPESGWYLSLNINEGFSKGVFNFRIKDENGTVIGENLGISFYDTRNLNVLILPVRAYWGKATTNGAPKAGTYSCKDGQFRDINDELMGWKDLKGAIKDYLKDVYPVADVNVTEGKELDASKYDLCTEEGMKALWIAACKRQAKSNGKDKYDIILAFAQYRQGEDGNLQGYTYTRPANIITYTDGDMLPTIAHEIAHCYEIGDEYNGGTYNPEVNLPPNGYEGSPWTGRGNITIKSGDYWKDPNMYVKATTDAKRDYVNTRATGTMVPLSLHPYSLSRETAVRWEGIDQNGKVTEKNIYPTMSFMGSGFDKAMNYWNTSVNWDHLLKSLVIKGKKSPNGVSYAAPEEYSNTDVYEDSLIADGADGEDDIIDEDDLYYDDEYRFGGSRMVEVNGWIVKDGDNLKVEMNPMFSFDGDLEYIEPLEDINKGTDDIYTLAALDKDGKVIVSPVDGKYAVKEFYAGFYCLTMKKILDEANFNFDAEYPEGTADFAIIKGELNEDGTYDGPVIWQASKDTGFVDDLAKKPAGYLNYADVNANTATLEWDVYYPEDSEEPYDNKDGVLYTEVYYYPEGDDGDGYYVACSDDENWEEGYISFDTSDFDTQWTKDAYVWVKVTNGVNAADIYSDDNDINLSRSTIVLSGKGIKAIKEQGRTIYTAEYTGSEIMPQTTVKAYDPFTDKYVSLKKDVDYSVSYEDNTDAGNAAVIVRGIGDHTGMNTQVFEITGKKIEGTPADIPDMKYTDRLDEEIVPYLAVTDKTGRQLIYNEEFTVEYTVGDKTDDSLSKLITEPDKKTAVTVTYNGAGNYTDKLNETMQFNVLPKDAADVHQLSNDNTEITLKFDSAEYTGKPVKPAVTSVVFKSGDEQIKLKSSEYKVVYSNNINLGTARVTIVGKDTCAGSAYKTFEIKAKQVTSVSITGLTNRPYTGNEIDIDSLPITVKAGGLTLKKGRDYTIEPVEGCNFTDVTTKQIKKAGQAPTVVVKLTDLPESKKAGTKPANRPIVRWADKVSENKKTVKKSFAIVPIVLKADSVNVLTKSNEVSQNKVKSPDGTKEIGTIRRASKDELANAKKKYAFVITGEEEALVKNAVITDAILVKTLETELAAGKDYTVSVSAAKKDKLGTITIKAVRDGICTGSKAIKFLYTKNK